MSITTDTPRASPQPFDRRIGIPTPILSADATWCVDMTS